MRVLVACEFSGTVRDAFRARGHYAVSCDLLPSEREGPHYMGDVTPMLHQQQWDLMIAHPPCTYLCSSGLHWNSRTPGRAEKTESALWFVRLLLAAPIFRIALENPIGRINTAIRKPDQTIQPYQFGHDASKNTCLWLTELPPLKPTLFIPPHFGCAKCKVRFQFEQFCPVCKTVNRKIWGNQTPSGQNKLGPSEHRAADRARTYQGIADAMAEQWGVL